MSDTGSSQPLSKRRPSGASETGSAGRQDNDPMQVHIEPMGSASQCPICEERLRNASQVLDINIEHGEHKKGNQLPPLHLKFKNTEFGLPGKDGTCHRANMASIRNSWDYVLKLEEPKKDEKRPYRLEASSKKSIDTMSSRSQAVPVHTNLVEEITARRKKSFMSALMFSENGEGLTGRPVSPADSKTKNDVAISDVRQINRPNEPTFLRGERQRVKADEFSPRDGTQGVMSELDDSSVTTRRRKSRRKKQVKFSESSTELAQPVVLKSQLDAYTDAVRDFLDTVIREQERERSMHITNPSFNSHQYKTVNISRMKAQLKHEIKLTKNHFRSPGFAQHKTGKLSDSSLMPLGNLKVNFAKSMKVPIPKIYANPMKPPHVIPPIPKPHKPKPVAVESVAVAPVAVQQTSEFGHRAMAPPNTPLSTRA